MTSRADRLVAAYRDGNTIVDAATPPDIDAAMDDQRRVAEALGAHAAGWKVAINPAVGPVAAPLMSHLMREGPASWPLAPGLLIEIEIAVRLGRDLPRRSYARAEIIDAIESMSVGVELVRSRLAAGNGAPFLTFLADNLASAGYVIGTQHHPWRDLDVGALRCSAVLGGTRIHDAPCAHPLGDPLAPVVAYASGQNDKLGGLRAGQIVTTGSLCGMIPVAQAGRLVAQIEGLGTVEIDLV